MSRAALVSLVLIAASVGSWVVVDGFQGMASPTRPPRPVARVDTDLPPITVDFEDVAERAGLTAPNVAGGDAAKKYILETTGNGVALFDYDNDGRVDIFLPNGGTSVGDTPGGASKGPPAASAASAPSAHLYRNAGGLRFEDVTARAGLTQTGWGQGVCVGDYDNDGHRDLFVTYYGQSLLWRNRGDGTFADVTAASPGWRHTPFAGIPAAPSSTTTSTAASISSSPAISNSIARRFPSRARAATVSGRASR